MRAALPAGIERRDIVTTEMRIVRRDADGDDDSPNLNFTGRTITYNNRTSIGNPMQWGFYEEIASGAAAGVLDGDTRMVFNHNPDNLLARTTNGTLRLTEDDDGVMDDGDMAPTSVARDVSILLDRKDLTGQSFMFTVAGYRWEEVSVPVTVDGEETTVTCDLRVITEIGQLFDVGPVTYPAYEDTEAGLRAIGVHELMAERRDHVGDRLKKVGKRGKDLDLELRYMASRYGLPL